MQKGAWMQGWIFKQNLRPFVALLAQLAGYALYDEDYDWIAIEYGIKDTGDHAERWYSYPLAGARPLTIELALTPGADVVSVRVTSETPIVPELAAQVDLLISICNQCEVRLLH